MLRVHMHRWFLSSVFCVLVGGMSACAPAQSDEVANALQPELQDALDESFPSSPDVTQPGFVLRISKSGAAVFQATSGAADIEQARLITSDTVFHIASLSKQITAAALAHAIEDGLVSLDDPVSRWVPETQKYGDDLTIAHLVYMTSGLTEYTDMPAPGDRPWATFHYFTTDDAIDASLSAETLQFEPGTAWRYNNINYMLIAHIVGQAYEAPFSAVVREKIFKPLGMTASLTNDDITTIIPNRANGYLPRLQPVLEDLRNGAKIQVQSTDDLVMIRRNAPHYGGSGVMTSMDDWSKWQSELLTHRVFGDAYWALMKSRKVFDHDKTNDAFGLVHGEQDGRATLWYSGGDIDTSTYAVTFPDAGVSVACFSNNPLDSCEQKAREAIEILIELDAL